MGLTIPVLGYLTSDIKPKKGGGGGMKENDFQKHWMKCNYATESGSYDHLADFFMTQNKNPKLFWQSMSYQTLNDTVYYSAWTIRELQRW